MLSNIFFFLFSSLKYFFIKVLPLFFLKVENQGLLWVLSLIKTSCSPSERTILGPQGKIFQALLSFK